ncbi:MAG TPA: sugar phosphate nucleotidyltransferase [Candidatus Hydrogenedentes bacterium]|nr:sugar phosphate nucleotidyltransferase [Candidatus Hydrogenedentota bacterium]HOD95946.1 sugar phosphate nucleotidyltransferase [Candidatus Hydrogenedentota bacterium]HOM47512.1 sugar phosphate nucleotidyltransferase [Candidatus Hydrogenedentota bacterium]HOR51350.1 sugar phosphate nucleotidyltransferase [Candidatus Hydrogenedentota bacterium]HPK25946.1 sugar phosphate nucleotidyltransferase [Candidatus Hydrogenedentota bacterium]
MQAVIMAAGKSTRTWPLTLTRPKPLLPVMGMPLLEHQLRSLQGIADEVIIIIGFMGDMIQQHYGGQYGTIRLRYVEQKEQRGTGHAVLQTADAVKGPFLVLNGDDMYDPADLQKLAFQPDAALAREVESPERFGIFEIDGDNRVLGLEEKPARPRSNLANIGAYSFTPDIFGLLEKVAPSPRGEIEVTDAVHERALKDVFRVIHARGYYLSIGYPWHLLEANSYWLDHFLQDCRQGEISPLAEVNGKVHIGEGTGIRAGVVIDGPAFIGKNCIIGPNCWIRSGTTIGNGCRIGQGTEIKNSVLFDGVFAAHRNYIGDSIIGEGCNLGAGTTTANARHDEGTISSLMGGVLQDTGRLRLGAALGDKVHTGIHTAIYPGRKLWPGCHTLPGSIIRKDVTENTPED